MTETSVRIREKLKEKLKPSRYEHTLGVCYTSIALAMRWGADLEKAELAGLLHDCAKRYDNDAIVRQCEKRGIPLTQEELLAPQVIHAPLGAYLAENKYGIKDPEILSAIACHTTGKPGMSLLDKILFTADFIEPGRRDLEHLDEFRKLAFIDLDEAFFRILENILEYLKKTGKHIDSTTIKTYDYYRQERLQSGAFARRADDAAEAAEKPSAAGAGVPVRAGRKGAKRPGWQKRSEQKNW